MTHALSVLTGFRLHAAEIRAIAERTARGRWSAELGSLQGLSTGCRRIQARSARIIIGSVGTVIAVLVPRRTSTFGGTVTQTRSHAASGDRYARRKKATAAAVIAAATGWPKRKPTPTSNNSASTRPARGRRSGRAARSTPVERLLTALRSCSRGRQIRCRHALEAVGPRNCPSGRQPCLGSRQATAWAATCGGAAQRGRGPAPSAYRVSHGYAPLRAARSEARRAAPGSSDRARAAWWRHPPEAVCRAGV